MKKFINEFKEINKSIVKIRNIGIKFSFITCLLFTYILYFYSINPISHLAFDIGYLGVKCSLMFLVSFFIGAPAVNKIMNKPM